MCAQAMSGTAVPVRQSSGSGGKVASGPWRVPVRGPPASVTSKWALGAVGLVAAVSLLAKAAQSLAGGHQRVPHAQRNMRALVQYAAQSAAAAQQDENPVMALVHFTTAIASLRAAMRVTPADDLRAMTGVDVGEMVDMLEDAQLQARQRVHQQCPALQPQGAFVAHTGWIGHGEVAPSARVS